MLGNPRNVGLWHGVMTAFLEITFSPRGGEGGGNPGGS